jgi:hypothetical protein
LTRANFICYTHLRMKKLKDILIIQLLQEKYQRKYAVI